MSRFLTMGRATAAAAAVLLVTLLARPAQSEDFPPHAKVLEGLEKVVSTADGKPSLYTLYVRKKDNQVYAELPKAFASQKHFIALTVSSGSPMAGLQAGDVYVYWRRYDKRLALIAPEVDIRSSGDDESKSSVKRLFTSQVLLDVPIATIGPGGGPVIDLDAMLVAKSPIFFGPRAINPKLAGLYKLEKAKAFPSNIEVAFEVPAASGQLHTLHYSISVIPESTGYKPRVADERIGYFTTAFSDLGKYNDDAKRTRYINRWHLEKADPKLKVSPPKKPIVFYIEHTTPVRYRRWVRKGILDWNTAFENVGLSNAIEVYYQDAKTGAHMDKDPEDVRYNFVRWLNNDIGTAIGPSRVNPMTGEILDADIILTDGWIRYYEFTFGKLLPKIAMESFSAETLAWLGEHPDWDPRLHFAAPAERSNLRRQLAERAALPFGGHPLTRVDPQLMGDDRFDGLVGRTSQVNGYCMAADGHAFDVALMRMTMAMMDVVKKDDDKKDDDKKDEKKDDKKDDDKKDEDLIDGMPEDFIGPLLAHLVAHEVGHTLGLRHNFKGSAIYTLAEINSDAVKGKKPLAASVMDYTPVNVNVKGGKIQGDWSMGGVGPYDFWAIEYGYTSANDLKPILARVAEPELQYATDEDTGGPDPLARRYDFSKNPLDYAKDRVELAKYHRERLLKQFVKDGESWAKARRGYEMTLSLQTRASSMMAGWVGGVHVRRDRKGDKNGRVPLEVVDAKTQRDALKFVIENTLREDAFGLDTDLLQHMTTDKWIDDGYATALSDATWPVHDRIMGIQASALTQLMNPTTLRRVYDNEFRVPDDQDALTLPELLDTLTAEVWSNLEDKPAKDAKFSVRKPMISSMRRNLQREHLKRLIDLCMPGAGSTAAYKPIANLSRVELSEVGERIEKCLKECGEKLDPYSKAHLVDSQQLIAKALDARYIYNAR